VHLQNDQLESTASEKLLGVHINQNLSWDEHIYSTEKFNRKLALLRRIKCFLTFKMLVNCSSMSMFYLTWIIVPSFGVILLMHSAHANRLLLTQKRVILDITDIQYPSNDMFKQLQWMPFSDRTTYRKATMVYKCINGLAPNYMQDMFKLTRNTSIRQTRSSSRNDLHIPGGKHKEIYMRSFAYSGAKLWNILSQDIRNKSSLNSFKHAYLHNYFNQTTSNNVP
jgi:hypothetical protein